eukprot:COSAG04_NODE_1061_length_8505_cov_15.541042_2_plen_1164_part_00
MAQADVDRDGMIDYREFVSQFKKDTEGIDEKAKDAKEDWPWRRVLPLALVLGVPGLAPAAWTVMLLRDDHADTERGESLIAFAGGTKVLKLFKIVELIVESVPQSVLQTYVGVAYGKFDPSSPKFSYLLPVSVSVSLLGAGFTVFGLEVEMRNANAKTQVVSLGSRYGIVGLLLRTAQVTALIFWISLLACAEKGWAAGAVVLGVLAFGGMCFEAAYRTINIDQINEATGASGKDWDSDAERWVPRTRNALIQWRLLRLWQRHNSVRASLLWSAIHLALLGGMAAIFFGAQHVPNNYGNKTLPVGGPDDPQHYDCHDRTSGLYPAYLACILCVLFAPLYAALDPEFGVKCMQPKSLGEKNKEQEIRVRMGVVADADIQQEQQAGADSSIGDASELWTWAKGKPIAKYGTVVDVAKAAQMDHEALCELLGAREREPVRGATAVLGGRAGTVIDIVERDGVDQIQVRWEDDGTDSPGVQKDDAIKMSDLTEPLSEGSAVRHGGRRGTAATDPVEWEGEGYIGIRWDDDGTLSDWVKVSELEVGVTAGRDDVAACAEQPERTAKLHAALLDRIFGDNARVVMYSAVVAVAKESDMEPETLCKLLGAREREPIGARAVLAGRVGRVMHTSAHLVDKRTEGWPSGSSAAPEPGMSAAESKAKAKYLAMTVTQLRRQCEDAWLSAAGTKQDMIARMVDYEKPAGGWGAGSSAAPAPAPASTTSSYGSRAPAPAPARSVSGGMSAAESKAKAKYMAMTLMQLRRQCEDAWLSAAGSKDEMVARLVDYEKPAAGWPTDSVELEPWPADSAPVQIRWEDDGTESPGPQNEWTRSWPDDAIKVSDLDEPIGEGSPVRHGGRRGTAVTNPDKYGRIMIRWEDDGTLSDQVPIKVSELEVEVTVGWEDFATACAEHPERTAKMHVAWLLMTMSEELKRKADTAVLDLQIAAVWRWVDTVGDGNLGPTQLRRLAEHVGDSACSGTENYHQILKWFHENGETSQRTSASTKVQPKQQQHQAVVAQHAVERGGIAQGLPSDVGLECFMDTCRSRQEIGPGADVRHVIVGSHWFQMLGLELDEHQADKAKALKEKAEAVRVERKAEAERARKELEKAQEKERRDEEQPHEAHDEVELASDVQYSGQDQGGDSMAQAFSTGGVSIAGSGVKQFLQGESDS